MNGIDYDVIIVGAGVSGCYLAKKLRESGLSIRILEQNPKCKIDSGIVSRKFFNHISDRSLIKSKIKSMNIVSPEQNFIKLRSKKPFAFLLNREKLGKKARKSVQSSILYNRFSDCIIHKGWVEVKSIEPDNSHTSTYGCKVLVGADGAMSNVRKLAGIHPPKITWGALHYSKESKGTVSVYFNKNYSIDGFAWKIPQNGEAGVLSSTKPFERMNYFLSDIGLKYTASKTFGAPIPIGFCRSYSNRIVLVGDAAGQTKPITGGGIVFGLECAKIAAKAIIYAFGVNRFDDFFWKTEYENKWHAAIGKAIHKQLMFRDMYMKLNNSQISRIFESLKPKMECVSEFDYDTFGGLAEHVSKFSIAKEMLPAFFRSSKNAAI